MVAVASSVFQRKDGRWVAQYNHKGKQKPVYGKTEEVAISKRQTILDALNQPLLSITYANNENSDGNSMTLGEWLSNWLDCYVKSNKGISTYTGYKVYVNKHIIPSIGSINLENLTPKVFQDYFSNKAKNGRLDGKPGGMSPKSMENMFFMLKAAMRQALENGLVAENHIDQVEIPKVEKKEAMALNTDELTRLIKTCSEHKNISAFGIILALSIGLKLGELLALKWSDIDFTNKRIHLHKYLNRCNDIDEEAETKSALQFLELKTKRTINMFDLNDDFISDMELYQNRQTKLFGRIPDVVIANVKGGLVEPRNYNKLFKRLLEESGISNVNFDILRNTFAVRYLEQGLDFTGLIKILGCSETSNSLKKFYWIYSNQNKQ